MFALLAALSLAQAAAAEGLDALRAKFDQEKSQPAPRRLPTLTAIGALKSPEAATVLAEILDKEKDAAVQAHALMALAACGTEPAIKKLAAVAGDPKAPILHRIAALQALADAKTNEGLDLAKKLTRESGDLRVAALLALRSYPLAETQPLWRAALNDPEPLLRGRALEALAPLRDLKLFDAAREALANPAEEAFVKYGSVAVCRAFAGPATARSLLGAALTPDPTLRRLLAEALGAFTDTESAKLVFAALRHADPGVRAVAARALGTLKHDSAMDKLAEPLRDKHPDVHQAALESVAERKDKTSEAVLHREAQRGEEESAPAVALLPLFPSDATKALLLKLAGNAKPGIALPALAALGELGSADGLPAYEKALKHKDWPVRSAAIRGLAKLRLKESVDLLVDRMAEEKGRLLGECTEALQALTGKSIGYAPGSWKEWWTANRETFAFGAEKAAATAGATTYHGVPVLSTRLVFCLDISGSMSSTSDGESRLEQAKKELSRVLGALDKDAHLNLVFFDDKVYPWQQSLVAIKSNLKTAQAHVSSQQPRNSTNIFDTLATAFQHKDVDTVYLLSDGEPTAGRIVDPDDVLREVRRMNRLRQIVIHTISFGPSPFMKRLADQNGGQYVEIR